MYGFSGMKIILNPNEHSVNPCINKFELIIEKNTNGHNYSETVGVKGFKKAP